MVSKLNWILMKFLYFYKIMVSDLLNLFIYFAGLLVCLSVFFLYPINVKTAEPIRHKFSVGPHGTPWKVYEWSKFPKICLQQNSIFNTFSKSTIFLLIRKLFWWFLFYNVYKEEMFKIEIEDGHEAPYKHSSLNFA